MKAWRSPKSWQFRIISISYNRAHEIPVQTKTMESPVTGKGMRLEMEPGTHRNKMEIALSPGSNEPF
jgi:hypothetical protein